MNTKICSECKIEKTLDSFLTQLRANGERKPRSRCKPCWNKNAAKRPGHKTKPSKIKYANKRKQLRAEGDFHYRCLDHLQDCRSSDKKKGRENDLTLEFVQEYLSKPCFYCEDNEGRMSLDRIDNLFGHLTTNVVSSCVRCNLTRGGMPYAAWNIIAPYMKVARLAGAFGNWMGDRYGHQSDMVGTIGFEPMTP